MRHHYHCLHCGRRQARDWVCGPCDGQPIDTTWVWRDGWLQDVLCWIANKLPERDRRRRRWQP